MSLVCIGSFAGHPRFKGLGELTPGELASLLQTRQPVGEPPYSLADRAWQAFREPAPLALDGLRHTDTTALPYLAAAIARFLQEFPWTADGLSRTERRLLQLAHGGGIDLSAAFPRMHEGEDAYYVTGASLASLAVTLARTSPPLLMRAPGEMPDGKILQGSVTLTEIGRDVLGGRRDRVAACGIDRWLGGVHLHGNVDVWRWDEKRQRIARL